MADAPQASLSWRSAISIGWLVAFRVVTRMLGVISTLVLARILVPADFGLVAIATTFSAGVSALSQIGVQDALLRRPENDRSLFATAFTLQALRGLITGSTIALAATPVARWFSEPRLVPVLLVLAVVSAVNGLENVGIVEFRRSLRYHYQFLLQVVPRVAGFCVTITMAFVLRNYWAMFAGIGVSEIVRLITSYTLHPSRPKFALTEWRKLVGFSFWLWLTSLACLVWDRCDPFILGPALGTAQLGVYLLAFEVATLPLTELVQPAAEVLFAGFSAAQREGTDTTALALSVAVTLLLIVAPVTIGISAGAGYVVAAMLGTKWYEAQPLISILAFLCVFSPFPWVSSSALIARGLVRHNFAANAIASVMKVSILTATVTLSGTMVHIAIAAVGVMGLEAVIFVGALAHAGFVAFSKIWSPLLRILIASATAILAADLTGLAWKPAQVTSGPAVVWGGLLGCLVALVFGVVAVGCWIIAGKPAGPESRLINLGKDFLHRYTRFMPASENLQPK
ncbi:MAG: oligosaccharide flippase family protein [Rhodopila sp.]|jgi:O-antigen/teichoic acid export membrane protein